ncbi:MAG: YMGG-like glycine zipper-containing protein [Salaquimonas sp.]
MSGISILSSTLSRSAKSIRLVIPVIAAIALSSCTTSDQNSAVIGGATGAVIGGVATGSLRGAAVGTAIGAGAGVLINRLVNQPGYCRYRGRGGRTYVDRCR